MRSLNRQCSSGLQAVVDIALAIRTGMIDVGIGAGVESMSSQYGPAAVTEFSELLDAHPAAKSCKVPMGVLSEKMARDRNIDRAAQDAFAARSYQRAEAAQAAGKFDKEIAPLTVRYLDPATDAERTVTVSRDDGIRPGITADGLAKIKPAFAKDGSIHAGNASQISDGAAAVLLMRRSTAERLGQTIVGKFVQAAVVGVPPLLMGIGPWKAIPVALQKAGLAKEDVDLWEINEAFASQCVWCIRELGLDETKVFPFCFLSFSTPTAWYPATRLDADGVAGEPERRRHCLWPSARLHGSPAGFHPVQRAGAVGRQDRRDQHVRRDRDGGGLHMGEGVGGWTGLRAGWLYAVYRNGRWAGRAFGCGSIRPSAFCYPSCMVSRAWQGGNQRHRRKHGTQP